MPTQQVLGFQLTKTTFQTIPTKTNFQRQSFFSQAIVHQGLTLH